MNQNPNQDWYSLKSKAASTNDVIAFNKSEGTTFLTDEFIDNAKIYTSITDITIEEKRLIISFANGLVFDCGKVHGDKLIVRKTSKGIEYRYETEPDEMFKVLVPMNDILFKFEELTPEQRDQLAFHFSDFTEEEIKLLQQPATEAGEEVRKLAQEQVLILQETNKNITEAEQNRATAESNRETNENNRKKEESTRIKNENTRISQETTRQTNEQTRKINEENRIVAETKREEDTTAAIEAVNEAKDATKAAITDAYTQANRAKDYADHQPKIVARQWWVYDETIKDYKNTGVYAIGEAGKSPIIQDDKWYVYNNETGEYEDTGIYAQTTVIHAEYKTDGYSISVPTGTNLRARNALNSGNNIQIVVSIDSTHTRYLPVVKAEINASNGVTLYTMIGNYNEGLMLYFIPTNDIAISTRVPYFTNSLTSSSTTTGLAANQGKILNEKKIDKTTIPNVITSLGPISLRPQEVTISVVKTDTSSGSLSDATITLPTASTTSAGVMPGAAYDKLMGIQAGAERNVQADWTVTDANSDAYIKNKPNLATVATSGSYNDLSNKPTISSLSGIPLSQKGVANGVASLDSNGTVPASQLPSYVDDVLEHPNRAAFPTTGESGKVYIAADTNITYRWSGSSYVVIGSDLALGETASTAYPGNKGKKNAEDIAAINTKFNNYSTTAQNDTKYLKLTGGTMTDRIHFNSTTANNRFVDFYKGSDYVGSIGIDDSKLVLNNHISGSQLQLRNDGQIWYKNQKVWYAGNDGAGSGLDADTVDGKHINNLMLYNSSVKANEYPLNEMGYGQTVNGWKFYGPCASFGTLSGDKKYVFQIQSALGGQVWARVTNDDGVTDWKEFAFLDADSKVAKAVTADSANILTTARTINGTSFNGSANITTANWGTARNIQIANSDGTNASTAMSVNGSANVVLKLPATIKATLTGNASSATNLATSRTLWGQSFNGTANVSGNMTGVGSITSSGEITTSALIKSTSSSSASGGFFRVGHPGASWNTGLGAYNVDINTNTSQTPLVLAYRKGTTDYAGANRLFAAELLNDGSILKFAFAGAEKMSFGKAGDIYAAGKVTATTFVGALQGNATTATTATTANAVAWNNVTSKPTWIGATKPTYTAAEVGALASNGTAANASKVANSFVLKIAGGTTENTNQYTFNGSAAKTLNITAGSNITLTPTAGGLSITAKDTTYATATTSANGLMTAAMVTKLNGIATGANNYTHPTTTGNKHIPAGGSSGQILRWSADGTAVWGADNNTTYSVVTTSANGLMSSSDKTKLDGIATGANKYSLPAATSTVLGGVKTGTGITNSSGTISVTYGTTAGTACQGNDARLSNSRPANGGTSAACSGNAATATKLQTARTIWGNSFDGTGNISGNMTGVINFTATGKIMTSDYITTTGNWFQVDKSGCGLYHSTHDIRLMGTVNGWQFENAVHAPGGFFKDSDIRLKSNIEPLNHTLEQILAIPTCSFDMDGKNQIGTIAQEIEKDFPYLVTEGIRNKNSVDPNYDWEIVKIPEGDKEVDYVKVKNVAYEQMSILNLEAVKLLNEKIEKLTSRVMELETKLSKYE